MTTFLTMARLRGPLPFTGLVALGVFFSALLFPARATPSDEEEQLERKLLACSKRFCLWQVTEVYLGSCVADDCSSHWIVATDLRGVELGGSESFVPSSRIRFLSDSRFEKIVPDALVTHNPCAEGWDLGVDPTVLRRSVGEIAKSGKEIALGAAAALLPRSAKLIEHRIEALKSQQTAEGKASITPEQLNLARQLCGKPSSILELGPPQEAVTACGDDQCLIAFLRHAPDQTDDQGCSVAVTSQSVRPSGVEDLLAWGKVSQEGDLLSFLDLNGGCKGTMGSEVFVLRHQPNRMAFISPAGLELPSAEPYPVLPLPPGSTLPSSKLATVVANSGWHLSWGSARWHGTADLSMSWQAVQEDLSLVFQVEVTDDQVVPLGEGHLPVASDHLEVILRPPFNMNPMIKVGVLLAAHGQAQLRLWQQCAASDPAIKPNEVDEPFAGSASWQRTKAGYRVRLALPLAALEKNLGGSKALRFELSASDADAPEGQKALIGNRGKLFLWSEYPPTIEEYSLVHRKLY